LRLLLTGDYPLKSIPAMDHPFAFIFRYGWTGTKRKISLLQDLIDDCLTWFFYQCFELPFRLLKGM